jgi:dienelactone hydrolase
MRKVLILALVVVAALLAPAPASASLNQLLGSCSSKDAADNDLGNGAQLPYSFCDDGVPDFGGTTPNLTADKAVTVPGAYAGVAGLPAASGTVPGADPTGHIALDVDVSLPKDAGPHPLVAMMHGCCAGNKANWEGRPDYAPNTVDPGTIDSPGGERWHYDSAWWASRGYVVLTYTSRGFVNGQNHGSTGEAQLDSNRFEINDFQDLVAQLVKKGDLGGGVTVDPNRIVATGGSYGGGFSWMALTDPVWSSNEGGGGTTIRLVAVAPKYGWTNLVESLVPNGVDPRDGLPPTDPVKAETPLGYPKRSITAALYASGKTGVPSQSNPTPPHTTFPSDIDHAQACLNSPDPYDQSNPLCSGVVDLSDPNSTLRRFLDERSAYLQNGFFAGLANGSIAPVPVFSAGTLTDQLFPSAEHRRMVERLKATVPGYPVEEYYGDYNHFVQNKAKEWGDVCGADRHVCRYSDYPGGNVNNNPPSLARENGATTRLTRFVDHYAKPSGDPSQPQPPFDVTASLQICPKNAGGVFPADEPGERFTAGSFAALTQGELTISSVGDQSTTFNAGANPHAKNADPIANMVKNSSQCPLESSPSGFATAGPGVATYDSVDLPRELVMIGRTRLTLSHTGAGDPRVLAARLYDLYPDGTQVLVDRGVRRLTQANGTTVLDLHGAGWRFPTGHRVRIEIAQDDDPYIKSSNLPGSLMISAAKLQLPIRGASLSLGGFAPPSGPRANLRAPRLASDQGTTSRIRVRLSPAKKPDKKLIDHYQLEARRNGTRRFRRLASRIRSSSYRLGTRLGSTYTLRARAVDKAGHAGPWDTETTITPYDDGTRMGMRASAGWQRTRSRGAFGGRLSRETRRGASFRFRFRGDRVYLVGRKSRRGGRALVVLGRKRRVISFYSRRTLDRRVVWKARAGPRRSSRLRVVALGTGLVEIDGLAVRRR